MPDWWRVSTLRRRRDGVVGSPSDVSGTFESAESSDGLGEPELPLVFEPPLSVSLVHARRDEDEEEEK